MTITKHLFRVWLPTGIMVLGLACGNVDPKPPEATDESAAALTAPDVVSTVYALKQTTPPTGCSGGGVCRCFVVQGYSAVNDGGGGVFCWDPTNTAGDNGGTVLLGNATGTPPSCGKWTAGSGTGRWIRQVGSVVRSTTITAPNDRISVKTFGAKGDGICPDTNSFISALAYSQNVTTPQGTYAVTGFSIPQDTTLELQDGALLSTTGPIVLNAHRSRLVGHTPSFGRNMDGDYVTPSIKWASSNPTPTDSGILEIGTADQSLHHTSATGISVVGIAVSGESVTGTVGIRIGKTISDPVACSPFSTCDRGAAFSVFEKIAVTNADTGLFLGTGVSATQFRDLFIRSLGWNNSNPATVGIKVGAAGTTAVINASSIEGFTVEGFHTGIELGKDRPVGTIAIRQGLIESFPATGCVLASPCIGINMASGGPYTVSEMHMEGLSNTTDESWGIALGQATGVNNFASSPNIHTNFFSAFKNVIRGYAWTNAQLFNNYLDGPSGYVAFSNNSSQSFKYGGRWYFNRINTGAALGSEMADSTGFDYVFRENVSASSSVPAPTLSFSGDMAGNPSNNTFSVKSLISSNAANNTLAVTSTNQGGDALVKIGNSNASTPPMFWEWRVAPGAGATLEPLGLRNTNSGNYAMWVQKDGNVGIGVSPPNVSHVLTLPNDINKQPIAYGYPTYSSIRWKENIETISDPLGKVEKLRGVYYDSKDSKRHQLGLIAEEVGRVIPEVVEFEGDGVNARSIDYGRLTGLLIEAVKAQKRQIADLSVQVTELKQLVRKGGERTR